jgi:transposase
VESARRGATESVIPPLASDSARFRQRDLQARDLIENFAYKFKQLRAIATRYDKTARKFLAGIHSVAGVILLN